MPDVEPLIADRVAPCLWHFALVVPILVAAPWLVVGSNLKRLGNQHDLRTTGTRVGAGHLHH